MEAGRPARLDVRDARPPSIRQDADL